MRDKLFYGFLGGLTALILCGIFFGLAYIVFSGT